MILIRPGLSFVFCLDCEQGQWWSEGRGPIPRPERMEEKSERASGPNQQ